MSGMHRTQFDLESMFGSYFALILIICVFIFYHVKRMHSTVLEQEWFGLR